jgi:hypothetical protein
VPFILEALPLHLPASIAHADKWQRLIQVPCPLWAYQLAKRSVVLGVGLEPGSQYSERVNVLKPVELIEHLGILLDRFNVRELLNTPEGLLLRSLAGVTGNHLFAANFFEGLFYLGENFLLHARPLHSQSFAPCVTIKRDASHFVVTCQGWFG